VPDAPTEFLLQGVASRNAALERHKGDHIRRLGMAHHAEGIDHAAAQARLATILEKTSDLVAFAAFQAHQCGYEGVGAA
jgi:hypothetical protein